MCDPLNLTNVGSKRKHTLECFEDTSEEQENARETLGLSAGPFGR